MNIHFNLELSGKASQQSQKSVLIRLTQNRKHSRISTGIQIEEKYWDKQKKRIKGSHPLSEEYNGIIQARLKELTGLYSKLVVENMFVTPEDLITRTVKKVSTNFFEFAYATKLSEIKANKKLGTYRRYESVLEKLKKYAGKGLTLSSINYQFLKEYRLYLKTDLNNTEDTVSANLSVIRSILNEAIRHGVYNDRNPFDQLQLKYTDNTKEKLTLDELKRIMITPLPPIPSLQLARDFFLACFLAEGTRAGDMILMKWSHIQNNCLVFVQQKTGTQMVIPIVGPFWDLLNRYQGKGVFIFSFLEEVKTINEHVMNSRITYINKYLKELAKYCGIFKKLTTHVSRHTFTDMALQATNENIYLVQKSLGHTSVKTTELYSRNRVNFNRSTPMTVILETVLQSSGS